MNNPYVGMTHLRIFGWAPLRWLWKKLLCPEHIHLFDECWSPDQETCGNPPHALHCDACGLCVGISEVLTSEEACRRVKAYFESCEEAALHGEHLGRIRIPVGLVEFDAQGNTIWVQAPNGTVLRIKATRGFELSECRMNPVSHADILVEDRLNICLGPDVIRF